MKNKSCMKRVIALVIFAVFMVTSVGITAQEQAVQNIVSEDYMNYVTVLGALGILHNGGSDYLESPAKEVTRADVAYASVKLLNMEIDTFAAYMDVPDSHWAYKEILQAAKLNIMSPIDDKEFQPEVPVTLFESANAFARVLCSDILVNDDSELVTKHILTPMTHELMRKVKAGANSTLNRVQFVSLLMNVLEKETLELTELSPEGANYNIKYKSGTTLLYKNFDIYEVDGVVSANSVTALNSPNGVKEGLVKIDDVIYQAGETGIERALGYHVTAYVKESDRGVQDEVMAFYKSDNNIIHIDAEDIISTQKYRIDYYEDEENRSQKLSRYMDVIYNGVMLSNATGEDLDIDDGSVTLIDNNRDGEYEVVLVNEWVDYMVSGADWKNDKIYDSLNQRVLDIDESNNNITYILTGEVITRERFEQITTKDDILTVAKSENSDGKKALTIEISFNKIDGILEEMDLQNKQVRVGSRQYGMTKALADSGSLDAYNVGDQVQIFLNAHGKICYIKGSTVEAEGAESYGYLLKVSPAAGLGDNAYFKIFDENGNITVFEGAKRIRFTQGGVRRSMSPREVEEELNKNFKQQLIKYAVNEDSLITSLSTAYKGPNDSHFSKDVVMDKARLHKDQNCIFISNTINAEFTQILEGIYGYDIATYGVEYGLGNSPKILYISGKKENGEVDEDKIQWVSDALFENSTEYFNVSMYDINDLGIASVTVIEDDAGVAISYEGLDVCNYIVVSKVSLKVDEDGEQYINVYASYKGAESEYKITKLKVTECPPMIPKKDALGNVEIIDGKVTLIPNSERKDVDNVYEVSEYSKFIQAGDVLQGIIRNGELTSFRRVFTFAEKPAQDADLKTIYAADGLTESVVIPGYSVSASSHLAIYGQVVERDNINTLLVKTIQDGKTLYRNRRIWGSTNVYVMERKGNGFNVRKGSIANIIPGKDAGSTILLHSRGGKTMDIVIFE